jgi:hypothetical protein
MDTKQRTTKKTAEIRYFNMAIKENLLLHRCSEAVGLKNEDFI